MFIKKKNAFKGLARARVKIVLVFNLPRIVGLVMTLNIV